MVTYIVCKNHTCEKVVTTSHKNRRKIIPILKKWQDILGVIIETIVKC